MQSQKKNGIQHSKQKIKEIQALSLAKECYSMKLDLLTNATVVEDAIRFVTEKSSNSKDNNAFNTMKLKDRKE